MIIENQLMTTENRPTTKQKAIALFVHIFTASGLFAGLMAIIAVSSENWRAAMAWLLAALAVDGVDGTFARSLKVKEALPNIDGKAIDTVVDFTNYAIVPAYFFYAAELAGPVLSLPLASMILLVSAIYYGKEGMISKDLYFIGFPVMWNVVLFYLVFVFGFLPGITANSQVLSANRMVPSAVVVIFSVLHFVPIKFAYPSRVKRMRFPTLLATVAIFVVMPAAVWFYPVVPIWLKAAAILNLIYFAALAVFDTLVQNKNASG